MTKPPMWVRGLDGWSVNARFPLASPSATDAKGGHDADTGMTDCLWAILSDTGTRYRCACTCSMETFRSLSRSADAHFAFTLGEQPKGF